MTSKNLEKKLNLQVETMLRELSRQNKLTVDSSKQQRILVCKKRSRPDVNHQLFSSQTGVLPLHQMHLIAN